MAYLRGQERIVYRGIVDHVRTGLLASLGWAGTGSPLQRPYGAAYPLTFTELALDPKLTTLDPNTIGFSEGLTPDEVEEELGANWGGLVSTSHTLFVDVYGENQSIAKAITSDIRAILIGRLGFERYLPLLDPRDPAHPAIPGHLIHFEDVQVDYPAVGSSSKLHWAVVKATAVHEYSGI